MWDTIIRMWGIIKRIWKAIKMDTSLWIPASFVIMFMSLVYVPSACNQLVDKMGWDWWKFYEFVPESIYKYTLSIAPVIVILAFGMLIKVMENDYKKIDEKNRLIDERMVEINGIAAQLTNTLDQSVVRLIEGTEIVKSEMKKILEWSTKASFFGPILDDYGFAEVLLRCDVEKRDLQIYDTYINDKVRTHDLIEKDNNSGGFKYNLCLYKQIVGVVTGENRGEHRQLFFFKDSNDDQLKGVVLNNNTQLYIEHLLGDIGKGIGPAIDFDSQPGYIRHALDDTLKKFWSSTAYGWMHPIMPPKCDSDLWNGEILNFFHSAAKSIAQETVVTKIVVTWNVTDKAILQAGKIESWLEYLKNSFVSKGTIERILLVDEKKYKQQTDYHQIVDDILKRYFNDLPGGYSLNFKDMPVEITQEGEDITLFYDADDRIAAVQGSIVDKNHKDLLRIYFSRDDHTKTEYKKKYEQIAKRDSIHPSVFGRE